jgi:hypothetical protein
VNSRRRRYLALASYMVSFVAIVAVETSAADDRCAAPRQELAAARAQLTSRVGAVRNMGFATTAATLEQWAELTEDARKQFKKYVSAAARDLMFTGAEQAVKRGASLNPWNVNTAVKRLKANGFWTSGIETSMRRIAAIRDKPDARSRLVAELKVLKTAIKVANWDSTASSVDQVLEGTSVVLGWLPKPPQASLGIAATEFGVALAFAGHAKYVSGPAIERMSRLTEQQLVDLKRRSAAVQQATARVVAAKRALKSCTERKTEIDDRERYAMRGDLVADQVLSTTGSNAKASFANGASTPMSVRIGGTANFTFTIPPGGSKVVDIRPGLNLIVIFSPDNAALPTDALFTFKAGRLYKFSYAIFKK